VLGVVELLVLGEVGVSFGDGRLGDLTVLVLVVLCVLAVAVALLTGVHCKYGIRGHVQDPDQRFFLFLPGLRCICSSSKRIRMFPLFSTILWYKTNTTKSYVRSTNTFSL
jgi:hypothetical protein